MKDSSPTHPSHFTNDLSRVRPNRLYAYLPDLRVGILPVPTLPIPPPILPLPPPMVYHPG